MELYLEDYEDHFDIGFEQFKLKPGLELEVQAGSSGRLLDLKAHFVMAHASRDVLIAIKADDAAKLDMAAGEHYKISGFNGNFDFSFSAEALKVDREQFTVLLAAPVMVSIRFVRKHRRADLAFAASVTLPGKSSPVQVTVKNLSLGGASISSVQPMGAKGDHITLRLQVTFDNKKEDLSLVSVIRRISEPDDSLMLNTGLEFVSATRMEKLLLHYFISTSSKDIELI
jgi:hypothetical protein